MEVRGADEFIASDSAKRHSFSSHPKYRPDIDGLRAIAVVAVVLFHAFPEYLRSGFIGVDIFFVISGFLISTILLGGLSSGKLRIGEFYVRRVNRIFPALAIVIVAVIFAGWIFLLPEDYARLGKHVVGGAGFVSNLLLWNESDYFDVASETKPLLHLWSLGVEEQFYILWPLMLWCAWKARNNWLKLIALSGVISFALNMYFVNFESSAAFYMPFSRFWELLIGSALAYTQMFCEKTNYFLSKRRVSNFFSITGVLLLCAGFTFTTSAVGFPGAWALMPVLGAAMIIAAGQNSWLNRSILSNRVFVFIGLISFPLYLWHWPILTFLRMYEGGVPAPELRCAALFSSVLIAAGTYFFIEKPLRRFSHPTVKAWCLSASMVFLGGGGVVIYSGGGVPGRFPEIIQNLGVLNYDPVLGYRRHTCLLVPTQTYSDFDKCGTVVRSGKESLYLWGDSHAAHLYSGYLKSFGGQYNITQRSASACPPIVGFDTSNRPNCLRINDFVFSEIKAKMPNRVVLAANWRIYDWPQVEVTIEKLKVLGVKNVDLIGPVPHWNESLQTQLYRYYKSDSLHRIPTRMTFGLDDSFEQIDVKMDKFATKAGVNYVSVKKIMCDDDGCITRFGDTSESLSSWDTDHLTKQASEFVVSKFPK
ncbi:acyltransferase family protein [Pseudomonas farris]